MTASRHLSVMDDSCCCHAASDRGCRGNGSGCDRHSAATVAPCGGCDRHSAVTVAPRGGCDRHAAATVAPRSGCDRHSAMTVALRGGCDRHAAVTVAPRSGCDRHSAVTVALRGGCDGHGVAYGPSGKEEYSALSTKPHASRSCNHENEAASWALNAGHLKRKCIPKCTRAKKSRLTYNHKSWIGSRWKYTPYNLKYTQTWLHPHILRHHPRFQMNWRLARLGILVAQRHVTDMPRMKSQMVLKPKYSLMVNFCDGAQRCHDYRWRYEARHQATHHWWNNAGATGKRPTVVNDWSFVNTASACQSQLGNRLSPVEINEEDNVLPCRTAPLRCNDDATTAITGNAYTTSLHPVAERVHAHVTSMYCGASAPRRLATSTPSETDDRDTGRYCPSRHAVHGKTTDAKLPFMTSPRTSGVCRNAVTGQLLLGLTAALSLLGAAAGLESGVGITSKHLPVCYAELPGRTINLYPLAALDGTPRFITTYNEWTIAFNPCIRFPGQWTHLSACRSSGDDEECLILGMSSRFKFTSHDHRSTITRKSEVGDNDNLCPLFPQGNDKSGEEDTSATDESSEEQPEEKTTENVDDEQTHRDEDDGSVVNDDDGVSAEHANRHIGDDAWSNRPGAIATCENEAAITLPPNITAWLTFKRGKRVCRKAETSILLQCDPSGRSPQDGVFQPFALCENTLYLTLSHACFCDGGCPDVTSVSDQHKAINDDSSTILNAGRVDTPPGLVALGSRDRENVPKIDESHSGIPGRYSGLSTTRPSSSSHHNRSTDRTVDFTEETLHPESNDSMETGLAGVVQVVTEAATPPGSSASRHMWLLVVANGGILVVAVLIVATCCRGASSGSPAPYSYLPALHSSRLTIASVENGIGTPVMPHKAAEYLDYSSPRIKSTQLPVLDNCVISVKDLDIGQRLGGGLFGDTYLAEWKSRPVAAKRVTVGVHRNQLTDSDYDWILQEVTYLSRQRHKHLVTVLGVSVGTRQPFVINEFVDGECLKDVLKRGDETLSWPRKLKLCIQVADGVAFLHSAKTPILHRDLRASNILIHNDRAKVVDFGLTRIVQRLRRACNGRKGCYCHPESCALPASIRWTAPELLLNPTADEFSDVITPSCDSYSYGMVLVEVLTHLDPFEEISDENQVMEAVLSGERPGIEGMAGVPPHLVDLITMCWDGRPDERPRFKNIAVHVKEILQGLTKGRVRSRSRTTSATYYLKSTLNVTADRT